MTKLNVIKSANLRITKPLYLREFSEALGEDYLSVWVNPDGDFNNARYDLVAFGGMRSAIVRDLSAEIKTPGITEERLSEITARLRELKAEYDVQLTALLARLWGCTEDDVLSIQAASDKLFQWCIERSFAIVDGSDAEQKKAEGAR